MHIQNVVTLIKNQFQTTIKCIRSNNGPEFLQNDFFSSKGILHQTSCVYTPQQNGRVERKHQHILNVARALMFQSNIPKHFWSYAIKHVVFLINRVPSPVIKNKTPFELLYQEPPDFSMIKIFGCLCYASTNSPRQKFDVRSKCGILLGFQTGTKGYVIFDINSKEICVSKNVQFNEACFPFLPSSQTPQSNPNNFSPKSTFDYDTSPTSTAPPFFESPTFHIPPNSPTPICNPILPSPSQTSKSPSLSPHQQPSFSQNFDAPNLDPISPLPRHSTRVTNRPRYLDDYYCNISSSDSTLVPHQSSSTILYPIQSFVDYSHLSSSHSHFFYVSQF